MLLISTALGASAVIDALRTVRSQDEVAQAALTDYAGFAAWSYAQHLHEAMTASAREVLGAVNHGRAMHVDPEIPGPPNLVAYIRPGSGCCRPGVDPIPFAFFGFSLRADTLGIALNGYTDPAAGGVPDARRTDESRADGVRAYPAADRRWLVDTLRRQIRAGYPSEQGFTYVIAPRGGRMRYLAYTLMPTAWGDSLVYGVEYAPRAFADYLNGVLDGSGLLPPAFVARHSNRDLLGVEILDSRDSLIQASGAPHQWRLDARARLPVSFGGIQVHAVIRPEMAGQLIIGGLPRSHLPVLLVLLAVAGALSVVAIGQLRREGELGRLRSDFVASVSHELRTPLAQIMLDLDTIRLSRVVSPIKHKTALDRINREAQRLIYLVENVLRFSLRGRGADPAPLVSVDVGAETRQIVDEFRPLAAARRATVTTNIAGELAALVTRDALRHVLLNLLDNAVKYGPPRQTVRVDVQADGARVRLTVVDEGPGVAAEDRERIWRPFQRGEHAAERGVGGSGIGLTIVREIVDRCNGLAFVRSAPGGGAAFVVELPLAPPAVRSPMPRGAVV